MTRHIAMWSGPRNISTAMMRAWENRGDCEVFDEPFYAHYLLHTGLDHPGRDAVIAAGEPDWRLVAERLTATAGSGVALTYQKHMTHHMLPHVGREWLANVTNVFLIRHPRRVLASYIRSRPNVTAADIGLLQQQDIYQYVHRVTGRPPLVLDAGEFLRAPEAQLRALCESVGVPFMPRMLHWPPGPRASDGVWAPHWYAQVYRSTGFEPPADEEIELPPTLAGILKEVTPAFEALYARRLRT
jgi:Sulfotransferase domain